MPTSKVTVCPKCHTLLFGVVSDIPDDTVVKLCECPKPEIIKDEDPCDEDDSKYGFGV